MRIEVKQKAFEAATPLIADLNFSVEEGEIVALIGPSGAGKSTLLNIIAGLDTDYDGNIADVPKRPVGLMFQEARLMPWLTALENVTLVAPASHPAPQSEAKKLLSAPREQLSAQRRAAHATVAGCRDPGMMQR